MAKNKLFSGRAPSAREVASIELTLLNMELRRAGLEPVRPGGSSLAKLQAAQEKGREALEQQKQEQERARQEEEERRREEEERRREEEERRAERLARYQQFKEFGGGLPALYTVLTSDEAADLRKYDSSDQLSIGEMYLSDQDFESIDDAAEQYFAQLQEAFDEMDYGDYDADFSGVPFF